MSDKGEHTKEEEEKEEGEATRPQFIIYYQLFKN